MKRYFRELSVAFKTMKPDADRMIDGRMIRNWVSIILPSMILFSVPSFPIKPFCKQ